MLTAVTEPMSGGAPKARPVARTSAAAILMASLTVSLLNHEYRALAITAAIVTPFLAYILIAVPLRRSRLRQSKAALDGDPEP